VPKHRDRHLWRYSLEEKLKGFQIIPRRWVVERTFAWLSRSRRLTRDYERLPETGEAMIHAACRASCSGASPPNEHVRTVTRQ
jgi:transposase